MDVHIRGKMNDTCGIALSSAYPAAHKIIKATSDSGLGQIIGMAAGQPSCFPRTAGPKTRIPVLGLYIKRRFEISCISKAWTATSSFIIAGTIGMTSSFCFSVSSPPVSFFQLAYYNRRTNPKPLKFSPFTVYNAFLIPVEHGIGNKPGFSRRPAGVFSAASIVSPR